jgi:large subunit ribosomal protein L12e
MSITTPSKTFRVKMHRLGYVNTGVISSKIGPCGGNTRELNIDIRRNHHNDYQKHIIEITVINRKTSFRLIDGVADDIISLFHTDKMTSRGRQLPGNLAHSGSISLKQVISIAQKRLPSQDLGPNLTAAVLSVLGTCKSVGCKVDGTDPKLVQQRIYSGRMDIERYLDEYY